MSICKDCIHYEICDKYVAPNESFPEVDGCRCFKDKSNFVEFPCKVGDTLWVRWSLSKGHKENIYPVKVYALRFDTKKNNMRICVEGHFKITAYGGNYTHYYNGTFAWNSIGKTVFLTRKQAEQALAEVANGT